MTSKTSPGRTQGSKNRTPEEIAVDQVELEARKRDRLQDRHDRLTEQLAEVSADLEKANRRVEYYAQNPDLPEGYEVPGYVNHEADPDDEDEDEDGGLDGGLDREAP